MKTLGATSPLKSVRKSFNRDFRAILRQELENRMNRNSHYTLRAFARDIKISSARLSEVLSGKKGLSRDAAIEIASRIGWSKKEQILFCDLVELECARSPIARELARERLEEGWKARREKSALTVDTFKTISEWYHFAILALMDLPGYTESAEWIGKELSITPLQAQEALSRLERVELTAKRDGRSYPSHDSVFSPDGVPVDALRKAHETLLKKTIDAIYIQPIADRDLFTFIMPINHQDMPEMKMKLRKFITEMKEDYSTRPGLNRVVSLSSQIVSLSQGEKSV